MTRLILMLIVLATTAFAQTAITSVTGKSLNAASRTIINGNFASILANAPNGKAALTTVGAIPYITAAGTLGTASMFTRVSAGMFRVYDTTATTGASTINVRAGAGQSTTPMISWANNGGTNIGAVNGDGSIVLPYIIFANTAEPTCDATTRSRVYVVEAAAGSADTMRICKKDASNNYAWTALY